MSKCLESGSSGTAFGTILVKLVGRKYLLLNE